VHLLKFARGASKNFVTTVTKIPQNDKNSTVNVVVDIVDNKLSFSFTGGKLNVFSRFCSIVFVSEPFSLNAFLQKVYLSVSVSLLAIQTYDYSRKTAAKICHTNL